MPLSDVLKNFLGGNNTSPTGGGGVQLQNIISPGTEQLLAAIPALLGSYEQARGVPIGNLLSGLGQLGMTHGANRQVEMQKEADISGRIQSLASQGLQPDPQTMDAIYRMSPEAADKELTDVENRKVAEQQTAAAQQQKRADWQFEHQKPFPLVTGGTEAYVYGPNGQPVRAPQYDTALKKENVNTPFKLFQQAMASGDYRGWNAWQTAQASQAVRVADSKLADKLKTTLNFTMNSTPLPMVKELRGYSPFDKTTLRPVQARKASDIFGDPNWDEKYVFVDKKTATDTIPQLMAGKRALITLAGASAKVLPHGTGSTAKDFLSTLYSKYKISGQALAGNVSAANFTSQRIKLALEIQKALTTSSRPVNLVEFNRITGEATGLTSEGEAVIPSLRDTFETAQSKLNTLQGDYDDRLSELTASSPAPGYYAKTVDEAMKSVLASPEAPTVISNPIYESPAPSGSGEDLPE